MMLQIEESGEFETVNDNISCGGRQYTGLGSILTGGMVNLYVLYCMFIDCRI